MTKGIDGAQFNEAFRQGYNAPLGSDQPIEELELVLAGYAIGDMLHQSQADGELYETEKEQAIAFFIGLQRATYDITRGEYPRSHLVDKS